MLAFPYYPVSNKALHYLLRLETVSYTHLMTIVMLAAEINDEFDIDIQVTDIVPENFNSAESILAMIRRHQEEDD